MQSPQNMEARLWEFIDGICSDADRTVITDLISSNQVWRSKYSELLQFNHSLQQNIDLDEPSMRFSRNVMEEIGRYQIAPSANSYINKKIIYGIAGFFLTLIIGFLIYAIAQIDWSAGAGTETMPFNLRKINFSKAFNNNYINAFMIVNCVLGLMLLDRYLTQQKKGWKNQGT